MRADGWALNTTAFPAETIEIALLMTVDAGVGDRRDRADHAERRELRDHHPVRAGDGLDLEVLGPRRLLATSRFLTILSSTRPRPVSSTRHPREDLGLVERRPPDRVDDDLAPVEVEAAGAVGRGRGRDRLVERRVDAVAGLARGRSGQLGLHGHAAGELGSGLADAAADPLDDVGDLALVDHGYFR